MVVEVEELSNGRSDEEQKKTSFVFTFGSSTTMASGSVSTTSGSGFGFTSGWVTIISAGLGAGGS